MRAQQAAAAVAKLELFPLKAAFRYKPCFMCSQITSEQLLLLSKRFHRREKNILYCIETPHVTRHRLLKMDSIYIFISFVKLLGTLELISFQCYHITSAGTRNPVTTSQL